jgi:hypothetical protein
MQNGGSGEADGLQQSHSQLGRPCPGYAGMTMAREKVMTRPVGCVVWAGRGFTWERCLRLVRGRSRSSSRLYAVSAGLSCSSGGMVAGRIAKQQAVEPVVVDVQAALQGNGCGAAPVCWCGLVSQRPRRWPPLSAPRSLLRDGQRGSACRYRAGLRDNRRRVSAISEGGGGGWRRFLARCSSRWPGSWARSMS